jgi:hypothetical protein
MCLHFDVRFSFERLDYGGSVFFPDAKRNSQFEIFFDNAQRQNGVTAGFQQIVQ